MFITNTEQTNLTKTEEKNYKMKSINFNNSNLYLIGRSLDVNGNSVVKVHTPNRRAFSIQTNGVLPETQRLLDRFKPAQLTEAHLESIEKEIVNYIENFGSETQKSRLIIPKSAQNKFTGGGTAHQTLTDNELTQIGSDYAYVTSSDYDRAVNNILDPEYLTNLLPKYINKIKEWEDENNTSVRFSGKTYSELYPMFAKGGKAVSKFEKLPKNRQADKKYDYFAVGISDGKIVDGWEIVDDVESLKFYAKQDLKDNDYDPKDFKILSKEHIIRGGINPFDFDNWRKITYKTGGEAGDTFRRYPHFRLPLDSPGFQRYSPLRLAGRRPGTLYNVRRHQ